MCDVPSEHNRKPPHASNGEPFSPSENVISLHQAEQYCRSIAVGHYENFLVASVFLPRQMRQPFYNVYAFCRTADDIADLSPDAVTATTKLRKWQFELRDCFAGQATTAIFVALADTAKRFELDIEPFEDLLDAFLQDQVMVRYDTFGQLLGYCQRSANPVGRIVLRLAKADREENLPLSDSICTGLQLANHWQDVARDFASGRIYLPREDLGKWGIDPERLNEPECRDAFCEMLRFQCERTGRFLRDGLPLAERVPRWLANDIRLFAHGGLATLDVIAKINYDVIRCRPKVSRLRQVRLIGAAALGVL